MVTSFTSSPALFPKNKRQMRGDSWYQLVLWQLYERVSFWSKVVYISKGMTWPLGLSSSKKSLISKPISNEGRKEARTSAYKGASGSRSQSIYERTLPTLPPFHIPRLELCNSFNCCKCSLLTGNQ